MERNKSVGMQPEVESNSLQIRQPRPRPVNEELRSLADHELTLVGGGDDTPGWVHP